RPGFSLLAQALAGEGNVQVYFTSSEFDGEVVTDVTLEPAMVRWGQYGDFVGNARPLQPVARLAAGGERLELAFLLTGESGTILSSRRPGAPPVTFTIANSDPRVVELNRLTVTLGEKR